jgi:hypothetical protein
MTVKTNKSGVVALACEGITVPGKMCDGSVEIPLPGKNPETKMPYTKAQRVKLARAKAAESKGWSVSKGADACPRVHSMVPQPVKARDRVGKGESPCGHVTQIQRAGVVKGGTLTVDVCGDPGCRAAVLGYVLAKTEQHPTYVSDSAPHKAAA